MAQLIAVGIGILVLIVGYVIYRVALQILDEGDYFFYAVGFFLVLFLIAGLALYFLLPRPPARADLTTVTPNAIAERLTGLADTLYSTSPSIQGESISYSLVE